MISSLLLGLTCAASPQVLHEFPVGSAKSSAVYRISRAPCAKKCALQVQLISAKSPKSAASLQWSPEPGKIEPLPDEAGRKHWSLEKFYALHASTVSTPRGSLLWVTSVVGWEHLHRNHEVFAVVNGALKRVWSRNDGQGPTLGTVAFERSGKHLDLIYREVTSFEPDMLTVDVYRWMPSAGRMKSRGATPLYFTIFGSHRSYAEALKQRSAQACLSRALILKSDDFPRLKPGYFVVAFAFRKKEKAGRARTDMCGVPVAAYVKRVR